MHYGICEMGPFKTVNSGGQNDKFQWRWKRPNAASQDKVGIHPWILADLYKM